MTLSDAVRRLHGQAKSAVIALRYRQAPIGCDPRHTTMLSRVLSRLVSVRVTVGYAVVLAVIDVTLRALGPNVRSAVVSHLSTNLYNLANGNLATLVASAFVTEGHHHIYFLLPGLVCLLALGELVWRSRRLILAFAVGHLGATLLVAVGVARHDRVGVAAGLGCPCQRRRYKLRRPGGIGRADHRDTASVASGLDRLVVGHGHGHGGGIRG